MQQSQIMTTYSPVKHNEKKYSIPTTLTKNHYSQRIAATPANLLNLHTTTKLHPVGTEYMCFQNDDKTAHADRCIKSKTMNKVIDSVL